MCAPRSITNIADRKSRQMLHRAKKANPKGIVVAVGCYVQADTQAVEADNAVDLLIGNNRKKDLVEILENYMDGVMQESVIDIHHTSEYEQMQWHPSHRHLLYNLDCDMLLFSFLCLSFLKLYP